MLKRYLVFILALALSIAPAYPTSIVTTGAGSPVVITPVAIAQTALPAVQTGGGTSFTFTSAAVGTAAADRDVIVYAAGQSGATGRAITSITVAGNTATLDASQATVSGITSMSAIGRYRLTTGTTATIVVTVSGAGSNQMAIAVYRMTGASVGPVDTATATAVANNVSSNIDIPANGAGIAGGSFVGGGTSATWTGFTEDSDQNAGGVSVVTTALITSSSLLTGQAFSVTASGATNVNLIAASYGP